MNTLFIILLLSLVQGCSEFLPISSAGHLLLIEHILNFKQGGLVFDMALNLGTLLTIIVYFRKYIKTMVKECLSIASFKPKNYKNILLLKLFFATIPIVIVGFLFTHFNLETEIRKPIVLGACLIIFGIILYIVDKSSAIKYTFKEISCKQSLFIGVLQCLAIIPGVSRSGITITAARSQGINRYDSVKFSFLIAIPSTLGAIVLTALNIYKHHINIDYEYLLLGTLFSFIFGLFFIRFLLSFISKYDFKLFMFYRIIIGLIIIALFIKI